MPAKTGKLSKKTVGLIIFGFIILISIITNPDKDVHMSKMKEFATTEIDALGETNFGMKHGINQDFKSHLYKAFLESLPSKTIKIENWIIFSITRTQYREKDHLLGVGIFGKIYIPNAKYFKKEIKAMHAEFKKRL